MSKIILTIGAPASTPTTGTVAIFAKVDKKVYFKDDTGFEAEIVSSAADIRDLGFFDVINDGEGSGLDADLLDGSHASAFATFAQGTLANSALQNIIEDTTPQLGGNLDHNTFSITSGGDVALSFSSDGVGATNWVNISAALTSTGPTISAVGTDINIDLVLDTKGTGDIDVSTSKIVNLIDPTSAQDAATKDYVDTEVAAISTPVPAFRLEPGSVTIVPGDEIVVLTSGSPGQPVALPPVGAVPAGTTFTLKNGVGTTGSIITPDGAETIDGVGGPNASLLVLPLAFTKLISDGASIWYVA